MGFLAVVSDPLWILGIFAQCQIAVELIFRAKSSAQSHRDR
jgi:hypothetical protein